MTVGSLSAPLGPLRLRSPLIAASGTFGSVVEFADVADLSAYGAAVAKSLSSEPWPGNPAPRLVSVNTGLLNAIGIQNPGIDAWAGGAGASIGDLDVPVWGSAVGREPGGFAHVAARLETCGVQAVEINLSCPNLDDGRIFAVDAVRSREIVEEVRAAVAVPIGAKLSPNAADIADVAAACLDAGADWLVLTNTIQAAALDPLTGDPLLTNTFGGFSGPPLKPISLRCVMEVHRAFPEAAIVGCGGITNGADVMEYLLAGAAAVQLGSVHFAEPRAAVRIRDELVAILEERGVGDLEEVLTSPRRWLR